MPLERQPEQVIPIRGLNTHTDPKSAVPGDMDIVENVFFRRSATGGMEARKRFGVTSLTRNIFGGGTISVGKKLGVFDDQRLVLDGSKIYSYSPQTANWHSKGMAGQIGIRAEKVAGSNRTRKTVDMAISGNLACVANVDDNPHLVVSVIDLNTGTRLLNDVDTGLGGASGVFVIALTSVFMIISTTVGGTSQAVSIAYATPTTVSGASTVANDLNASGRMDCIRNGSNDSVLVAYHSTTAGKITRIKVWNSNMTAGSDVGNADASDQCLGWLNWDFSNGKGYLAYSGSVVGAKLLDVTQSALAISATTVIDATVTAAYTCTGYHTSAPSNRVFFEVAGAGGNKFLNKVRIWTGGGATSVWQLGCGLGSKAFTVGGSYYVTLAYEDGIQNVYFVAEASASTPTIVGKALYGLGGGVSKTASVLGAVPAISSTVSALPVLRFSFNQSGLLIYDAYYLRLDFAPVLTPYRRLGDNLLLNGGVVRAFDGTVTTELGHHVAPVVFNVAQAGGGALTVGATYQITACFAWVDNRGQVHRSAPAAVQSFTLTAGNQTLNFSVTYSRIGDKVSTIVGATSNMFLEVYMTAGNGQTFYRLGTSFNDTSLDSLATGNSAADATLVVNAQLYTTGGVLPHIPPPPATLAEIFQNRVVLAGTENPLELWIGNEYQSGLGPSFSDALVIAMEAEGGAVTAIAEVGGRLAIFKRSRIYLMAGAGPSLTGAGQFDQPTLLTPLVGAVSTAGIIKTNDGAIFKSEKGTYLLPIGGGQPVRLGNVEAFDSLNLTASTAADGYEHVRMFTDSGRTLVYHFGIKGEDGLGVWSTYTGQAAVDAISWNGKVAYLDANGTVKEEVSGQWADDGASITSKIRWARLNLAGLFGRLRLYGLRVLAEIMATFTLSLTSDITVYGTTLSETDTLAVTTATIDPIAAKPAQERVETLQVTVQETSTTEGFRVSALGIEIGAKPGAGKQPAGQFAS